MAAGKSSSGTVGVPMRVEQRTDEDRPPAHARVLLARDALDLRGAEIGVRRREVVIEGDLAHQTGTCQPPSAFSTKNRRSCPQKRKRRPACSTTKAGTPKAPSATARVVAARSASLISGESMRDVSPYSAQYGAIGDIAIIDEVGAIERPGHGDALFASDGVQKAHGLDRAQRMARMELQRYAVICGVSFHIEQIQMLFRGRHGARGHVVLPDGAEDSAEQHRHPLDLGAGARRHRLDLRRRQIGVRADHVVIEGEAGHHRQLNAESLAAWQRRHMRTLRSASAWQRGEPRQVGRMRVDVDAHLPAPPAADALVAWH